MSEKKEFYTSKELATVLHVTERTIARMVDRGELPAHKIGRAVRFRSNDVEAFLTKCRTIVPVEGGKHGQK